jgi:hypothetical protein
MPPRVTGISMPASSPPSTWAMAIASDEAPMPIPTWHHVGHGWNRRRSHSSPKIKVILGG